MPKVCDVEERRYRLRERAEEHLKLLDPTLRTSGSHLDFSARRPLWRLGGEKILRERFIERRDGGFRRWFCG